MAAPNNSSKDDGAFGMTERQNPATRRDPASRIGSSFRKLALAIGTIVMFVVLWRFTPLRSYMGDFHRFKDDLERVGFWAPLFFTLVSAFFIGIGISRLVFCAIAGAAFGFLEGVLYSEIAAILGAYVCFLYARWLGGGWVTRRLRGYDKLSELIRKNAFMGTVLVRQLPISGVILNLALGLSSIPHSTFLLGSAVGFLPEGMIATLLGSGSVKGSLSHALWQIALALLIGASVGWALWQIHRKASLSRELEAEIEQLHRDNSEEP